MYVTTCLMFAAVRWFHVCPGAKEKKSYYYPDRKIATLFYAVPIILLPYILNPASQASWMLVKGYYPLTHFFYCAVLLFNYFGKVRQWRRWHTSGIAASVLVSIATALLLAVALMPECKITEDLEHTFNFIIIVIGLLMTIYSGVAIWQVWQWIREYSTDNFSNTDDFPLSYARGVIIIPMLHALLIWPIVLLDSPKWLATIQLLLAVFNIIFLISVLPSQRKGNLLEQMIEDNHEAGIEEAKEQTMPTEEEVKNCPPQLATAVTEKRPDDAVDVSSSNETTKQRRKPREIPDLTRRKIIEGIEQALTRQQLFLNPHLTLGDVAEVCGYGQTYVSKVFKEKYGGFYDHINMLRFRYADDYMHQHPDITKEEAIIKAGFADRTAYYRFRKHFSPEDV